MSTQLKHMELEQEEADIVVEAMSQYLASLLCNLGTAGEKLNASSEMYPVLDTYSMSGLEADASRILLTINVINKLQHN